MSDVIEVSYTGDLLAHRRCGRAWAYEKHAGFRPYELVQAMEGRLIHHAMEWLTRQYHEVHGRRRHASKDELRTQLDHFFRVLWARGIRTAFVSRDETLGRVVRNLYPEGVMDPIVRAAIEGAQHTEYELRAVRKVLPGEYGGKNKILLTGILDLVIQQEQPLRYERTWRWDSLDLISGKPADVVTSGRPGDVEIWDYKGTKASTGYLADYVRQVLTYAALYEDRAGTLPARCVLFFINEKDRALRLLAIDATEELVQAALRWTKTQVRALQATIERFESDPEAVIAGELGRRNEPLGCRLTDESTQQCTTCGLRFDCTEYRTRLGPGSKNADIDLYTVFRN